jgi:serine/threonine-protein kinase
MVTETPDHDYDDDTVVSPVQPDRREREVRNSEIVPARRAPRVGDLLDGTWRLEEVLGSGGSAHVFAATHIDGQRAAVKVLREELCWEPTLVARFVGDGRIANLVRHPGVVIPLHEGATESGIPFLVVERLDGQTLEERIATRGPLSLPEATAMIVALLDVLAATHDRAIIHRDVKPENVFLTRGGRLKLIDFGIARPPLEMAMMRTREQTVMGTPAFMSPEQARGIWSEIDARSDLWGAGATFFRAVTGRFLRNHPTVIEDLIHAVQPLPPMSVLAPELPVALGQWLDRALAFDRRDRFWTAWQMSASLPTSG